jgi:hypothetical protein
MNVTLRQIAVSGGAAVALLGGAAAITIADSPTASAVTQTVAHRSVTAPVNLPDGRTIRISGLGGYGHTATAEQISTATTLAASSDSTGGTSGITNGLTPDGGAGAQLQIPYNTGQVPAGYQQQISTQSAGGYIGVGVATIVILGLIVGFKVRHGGMKVGDAVIGGLFGIALSGTVVGAMGSQLTHSLVGSLGSMLGGLG